MLLLKLFYLTTAMTLVLDRSMSPKEKQEKILEVSSSTTDKET